MTNRIIAVTLAIVAVAFLLLVKHDSDARRSGRIAELDAQLVVLAATRDSLTHRSDSLAAATSVAADTFRIHDVRWKTLHDTVPALVERIVHDTLKADTTKIRELVVVIDTLTKTAQKAIAAAEKVVRADSLFRLSVIDERAAWSKERNTQATEISLLKKQSRHWGICAAGGYGVMRTSSGVIQAGPIAGVAICWRY